MCDTTKSLPRKSASAATDGRRLSAMDIGMVVIPPPPEMEMATPMTVDRVATVVETVEAVSSPPSYPQMIASEIVP